MTSRLSIIPPRLHILSQLSLIALMFLLISEVSRRAGNNHVSYDIRTFYLVAVGYVLFLTWDKNLPLSWKVSGIALALTLSALVLFLDQQNLLVEHGTWCRRGMPGPNLFFTQ